MKYLVKTMIVLAMIMAVLACTFEDHETVAKESAETATAEVPDEFTDTDKISYCLGLDMGVRFSEMDIEVTPEVFLKGMEDGISGAAPVLSEEERQRVMNTFEDIIMERQMEMMAEEEKQTAELAAKNKEEGDQFLVENKEKEGVITTESGLQYIVIEEGQGDKPGADDTVSIHYLGTLLDGTEFDSSYNRNQPATLALNGVIPGWTEGVQLMSPGAKYKFFMPSDLAYGPGGAGGDIGPDATLIFEVELIEVKSAGEDKQE
jgi:FKBP-type peptidyl-prolyl cis-trans isomerase